MRSVIALELPSGEITLLFSDVEASTRAWEEHPDAMPAAMALHQATVRSAVEDHGGVVVKDTGDGLFAVFGLSCDAIAAAVDAQRGLQDLDWKETGPLRARMGLHTGEAEPIGKDYHGPAVNRCARVMDVAHGGQIVVSSSTHHDATRIRPGLSFLDLGTHRLRDLSASVHLYQVLHPQLPDRFPPLRSLDVDATNLPAELSSFVGRQGELARLTEFLLTTPSRLLTLTGVGGVGKTRLALQLAARQIDRFADGVWLVNLAGLTDPAHVAPQVASALRIAEQPARTWVESVVWFLRDRAALLVLDNCEHLLEEVASLADTLLRACPLVGVLATSREALDVRGETTWQVAPLSLSGQEDKSEAEHLLLDRVLEVDPRFRPSEEESAAMEQICRQLDGMPLAIELAAARARALSLPEIAHRLGDRFRLLTGGSRIALPRQRTLEATVAWSYDLLDEPERQLFNRLSIFSDSFGLEAIEQVCSGDGIAADDLLDLVTRLTERSMLVRVKDQVPARYRLLETLRAYGRERLAERGGVPALRDRHLEWINDFARSLAPVLDGPEQERALDQVATEINDIRAALTWALESEGAQVGLGCAATLYRYWYIRGVSEGRQWLDRLLAAAHEAPAKVMAKALYADGSLAELMNDSETAAATLERSLAIYGETGNRRGAAWALHGLGMAEWTLRQPEDVRARFDEALSIFRELHDPLGIALTLQFIVIWEAAFGDAGRAVELIEEQGSIVRPTGMPHLVAHNAELSAMARWKESRDPDRAAPMLHEAIQLYGQIGSLLCAAHCLENTAAWAAEAGASEDSARLLGATARLREDSGTPVHPYENLFYDETRDRLVATLGPERYERAVERGRSLDFEQAIEFGLGVVAEVAPRVAEPGGTSV